MRRGGHRFEVQQETTESPQEREQAPSLRPSPGSTPSALCATVEPEGALVLRSEVDARGIERPDGNLGSAIHWTRPTSRGQRVAIEEQEDGSLTLWHGERDVLATGPFPVRTACSSRTFAANDRTYEIRPQSSVRPTITQDSSVLTAGRLRHIDGEHFNLVYL